MTDFGETQMPQRATGGDVRQAQPLCTSRNCGDWCYSASLWNYGTERRELFEEAFPSQMNSMGYFSGGLVMSYVTTEIFARLTALFV